MCFMILFLFKIDTNYSKYESSKSVVVTVGGKICQANYKMSRQKFSDKFQIYVSLIN